MTKTGPTTGIAARPNRPIPDGPGPVRAPRLVGGAPDRADGGTGLARGEQAAQPAVGQPAHPPQPGQGRAAEPQVQPAARQEADPGCLDGEELPGEVHSGLLEQQPQQGQRLVEDVAAASRRHGEPGALGGAGRLWAENRQDPMRGEPRHRGQLLGHQDGVPARQHADPRASLSRRVRAAAKASPMNGSTCSAPTCSESHTESMPASSSRSRTAPGSASGVPAGGGPGAGPSGRPIPMRTTTRPIFRAG
jgi:hypothetical protein